MAFNDAPITMPLGRRGYKGKMMRQNEFINQVISQKALSHQGVLGDSGQPRAQLPEPRIVA